jgi:hypothetical protein
MAKYLLNYVAPVSAAEQMQSANPEDGKKMMDLWMGWFQRNGSAIVDVGTPTQKVASIGPERKAEGHIGGYSIVQADSVDALKGMLKDHPHMMMPGASIEIMELLAMPGM